MLLKRLPILIVSVLLLGFPFEHFRYRFFRSFSRFLLDHFKQAASFSFEIPTFIDKYLHLYPSEILILSAAFLLYLGRNLGIKEWIRDRASCWLLCLFIAALGSILFSKCSSYYYLYFSMINLGITCIGFHITSQIFYRKEGVIHMLLWGILIVAAFECFVGIGQFLTQKSMGFHMLGEPKLLIDRGHVATIPMPEKGRALFQYFTEIPERQTHCLRAYGTFGYPNSFSGFLVLSLMASHYCFLFAQKKWLRGIVLILLFFQILTLLLTFSRAGLFSYFIVSVLWFILTFRNKKSPPHFKKNLLTLGSLLASICLIFGTLLFPFIASRGGIVNYNEVAKGSDHGRTALQKVALETVKNHPFTGIGYNCYTFFPGDFLSATSSWRDRPHSIYLMILCEMGGIGLACFACFLISLSHPMRLFSASLIHQTLLMAFIGFLLIGFRDLYFLTDQSGKMMFFLIAGLVAATAQEVTKPNSLVESASSQSI